MSGYVHVQPIVQTTGRGDGWLCRFCKGTESLFFLNLIIVFVFPFLFLCVLLFSIFLPALSDLEVVCRTIFIYVFVFDVVVVYTRSPGA